MAQVIGESNSGFDEAAKDAARKAEQALGKGQHKKLKVDLELDISVSSPGNVGTYRVIVTK